ncbi:MAG: hypothetical protein AUK54_06865 [Helicobacteraceae bacterium CG2_30_36_10]|nr:MAG: hypothetical protein AUK54_06865 [Helicobacteraceae bacterium CG2_30_36_10]
MYTLNYKYINDESLDQWLHQNNFSSKQECFVQFFCGITHAKTMQVIATKLEKELPHANIIGTTTDGEIIVKKCQLQ